MRKKLKWVIGIIILIMVALPTVWVLHQRERDVFIYVISTFGLHCYGRDRGYRFIVWNDGTLVTQYGILRHNHCEHIGGNAMIVVLDRSVTVLSEAEMQEIAKLVNRISQNYPIIWGQVLLREKLRELAKPEYQYTDYFEYEDSSDGETLVFSSHQAQLLYNGNVYGIKLQIGSLFYLDNLLWRLSPLTR